MKSTNKKPNITGAGILIFILAIFIQGANAQVNHAIWNQLLYQYVSEEGFVNYKGIINKKDKLNQYLKQLSNHPPEESLSKNEKLAYWINAYNAFTVKLIVDHYPVNSIKDLHPTVKIPGINTVWKKEFFKIDGKPMSLHHIEHNILREEFHEPRIHFAINCASFSCPPLRNEAYKASNLEKQLEEQAVRFINNSDKNQISTGYIKISKIFKWFTKDFTRNGDLIDYLNQYAKTRINKNADIDYMDYDWSLNEK